MSGPCAPMVASKVASAVAAATFFRPPASTVVGNLAVATPSGVATGLPRPPQVPLQLLDARAVPLDQTLRLGHHGHQGVGVVAEQVAVLDRAEPASELASSLIPRRARPSGLGL